MLVVISFLCCCLFVRTSFIFCRVFVWLPFMSCLIVAEVPFVVCLIISLVFILLLHFSGPWTNSPEMAANEAGSFLFPTNPDLADILVSQR